MVFLISQCEFGDDVCLGFVGCDSRAGDIQELDWILLASLARGSLKMAISSCPDFLSQPYC